MPKAIFDGAIKTVIVWKLDRISRVGSSTGSASSQIGVSEGCELFPAPNNST